MFLKKIQQNPDFRRKLVTRRGAKFFEGTYNRKYGCGSSLKDAHEGKFVPNKNYKNLMGKIYEELIAELQI